MAVACKYGGGVCNCIHGCGPNRMKQLFCPAQEKKIAEREASPEGIAHKQKVLKFVEDYRKNNPTPIP